jgi:hypothetical protein
MRDDGASRIGTRSVCLTAVPLKFLATEFLLESVAHRRPDRRLPLSETVASVEGLAGRDVA